MLQFIKPWDWQPQELVSPDYFSPSVRFAFNGGRVVASAPVVTSLSVTGSIPPVVPTQSGIGTQFSGSNGLYGSNQVPSGSIPDCCMVAYVIPDVRDSSERTILSSGWSGGTNPLFRLQTTAANTWQMQLRDNFAAVSTIAGGSVDVGVPVLLVGYFSGPNEKRLYVNGVRVGTSSTVISTTTLDTTSIGVLKRTTEAQFFSGKVLYAGYHSPEAEYLLLGRRDPWQLFTPRTIWVPVSAATGGDITIALTGQAATSAQGTLGTQTSVAVSGQAAATVQGTLGLQTSKAVTGQAVTSAQGTLGIQTTLAVTGQVATTAQGTITATTGGDITLALTGQAVTAAQGSLGLATAIAASGQAVTAAQGTLGLSTATAISGQAAVTSQGVFGRQFAIAVSGQAATTAQGTITATGGAAMSYTKNANLYLDVGGGLSIMLGNPRMPAWNTAGRPGAPLDYTYGFNTDTAAIEVWTGSAWV